VPAGLEEEEEFYSDAITRMEERADYERTRAEGVQVEIDLTENTTFARYVQSQRNLAIGALTRLMAIEPTDPIAILREQNIISSYLHVRAWAMGAIESSEVADQMIQEASRDYQDLS
jgi:hypothetical protein